MIDKVKNLILHESTDSIEALILVGSFARGEEIVREGDGKTVYVSDLEFLAVVKPEAVGERFDVKMDEIEVSIGVTTKEHLKRFKPYIFTVEVKKYGKVVWGDAKVLDLIPNFSERDIDPLDSFILLNNRMVEQIKLRKRMENGGIIESYDINKGYIQLVNSILAFEGQYHCKYPDKLKAFMDMDWGEDFKMLIREAFESLSVKKEVRYSLEDARERWFELREGFREVYKMEKKLAHEHLDHQIKGWAKLFLQSKSHHFKFMEILGSIFVRSPQFLIYRQAAQIYFADEWKREEAADLIEKWEDIVK